MVKTFLDPLVIKVNFLVGFSLLNQKDFMIKDINSKKTIHMMHFMMNTMSIMMILMKF